MKRLFVFDIDGTLVNRTYELKQELIDAINTLINNGDIVATCSGRPYIGSMRFLSQFNDGEKYAICANGAMIYKADDKTEILKNSLKFKDYLKVYKYTSKVSNFFTYFYRNDKLYHMNYEDCIELDKKSNNMESYNVDDSFDDETVIDKIMVRDKSREFMKDYKIPAILKLKYQVVKSSKVFLEITAKGATKGNGVEILRKHLNISKENVYVFGDSGNDVSMIKKFKNSVAMGNGIDKVKKHAKYVTLSVDELGVAHALKNILKVI